MENRYQNKSERIKSTLKGIAIGYALLGSLSMLGSDVTGHRSADVYLGKSKLMTLEKEVYKPIFEKLNIETNLIR